MRMINDQGCCFFFVFVKKSYNPVLNGANKWVSKELWKRMLISIHVCILRLTELCVVHVTRRLAPIHTYTHIGSLALDQYERGTLLAALLNSQQQRGLCSQSHSVVPLTPWWISDLFSLFSGSFQADAFLPKLIYQVRHFRFRSHHAVCHPIQRSWQIIRTALNQSLPIFQSQPLQRSSIH